jgi:hypothetical protein
LQAGPRVGGRAQFDGTAAQPTAEQWPSVRVALEPANGTVNFNVSPGYFAADGSFATPSTWPGKYLIRVPAPPPGWTFKGATHHGRDVSDSALELSGDLDDVMITFTDRPTTVSGTVQDGEGQATGRAVVLLFSTDDSAWVDYGRSGRRVQMALPSPNGAFTMPAPPAGEYYLMAISSSQAEGWQNPTVLRELAVQADRVQIRDRQSATHTLRIKTRR